MAFRVSGAVCMQWGLPAPACLLPVAHEGGVAAAGVHDGRGGRGRMLVHIPTATVPACHACVVAAARASRPLPVHDLTGFALWAEGFLQGSSPLRTGSADYVDADFLLKPILWPINTGGRLEGWGVAHP